jgi:hypothetical protein
MNPLTRRRTSTAHQTRSSNRDTGFVDQGVTNHGGQKPPGQQYTNRIKSEPSWTGARFLIAVDPARSVVMELHAVTRCVATVSNVAVQYIVPVLAGS